MGAVPEVVVVDHEAGEEALVQCLSTLAKAGAERVVVVDNAVPPGSTKRALRHRLSELASAPHREVDIEIVEVGANLGYGSGVNRGVAMCSSESVLVCNPDLVFEPTTLEILAEALSSDPAIAIAGPRVNEPDGTRYPSARRFPSLLEGAGHALAGLVAPNNRFTRRYRMQEFDETSKDIVAQPPTASGATGVSTESTGAPGQTASKTFKVDWVSGSCMLVRRRAFEELGGFDESYFMYGEDVDLCWRAHRAGWTVVYAPRASVTHVGGLSTRKHPYRMLAAHHRSTLRFASKTLSGPGKLALPLVAGSLGVRLAVAVVRQPFKTRAQAKPQPFAPAESAGQVRGAFEQGSCDG